MLGKGLISDSLAYKSILLAIKLHTTMMEKHACSCTRIKLTPKLILSKY